MATWELDGPDKLAFDKLDRVLVRVVEGAVDVVGSDDQPTLEVSELTGEPLQVRHQGGELTIDYKHPRRLGPLAWLMGRGQRCKTVLSLAVPRDCPVELHVVSASVMVGGLRARTVSGAVAVDLLASGERDIQLSSVSGDLTVRVPGASDLRVRLQSTTGRVASAFEELEHERAPGRHAASGRLGAGSGRLKATSVSGHVALLRRTAPEGSL